MKRTPAPFDKNVDRWVQYSQSWRGQLRRDVTWYNLERHVKSLKDHLRVLDAGCGLGDIASLLLAKSDYLVLLDFSKKMLENARELLLKTYPQLQEDRLIFVHGHVEELDDSIPDGTFDLILCHTLLEYVENPRGILASLVRRLARGGLLSIVTVNRFSEVLRLAILKNDLARARRALHKRDLRASLFNDLRKNSFSFENLEELLGGMPLRVAGRYGIRIFADYLPEEQSGDPTAYPLLFELESEASKLSPFLYVGRYLHLVCRKQGD